MGVGILVGKVVGNDVGPRIGKAVGNEVGLRVGTVVATSGWQRWELAAHMVTMTAAQLERRKQSCWRQC
jgi:hypothetical protein